MFKFDYFLYCIPQIAARLDVTLELTFVSAALALLIGVLVAMIATFSPSICPAALGRPRFFAQRPLPSMMNPTWVGTVLSMEASIPPCPACVQQ